MPYPILMIGDAPDQSSGLARILRDLCTLLAADPNWHVASLGYMGIGSARLPWQQYQMAASAVSVEQGVQVTLPHAWTDHAGDKAGIVMTIWDATRLHWLAQPELLRQHDPDLADWLLDARARRWRLWGYFPFDATGPDDRLTTVVRDTLMGFDRILTTSPWGCDLVRRSIGDRAAGERGLDWLPHAIGQNFTSADVKHDEVVIGIVGTNQERKNWHFAAELCRMIRRVVPKVRFWWHVDTLVRHISIPALLADFDLERDVTVTQPPVSDQWLAEQYRRCTLTLLPTLGEGFGYPWLESFASGTPCLHTNYAGGASVMGTCGLEDYLVPPSGEWRFEGQHNCARPVLNLEPWVNAVAKVLREPVDPMELARHVDHLRWGNIAGRWLGWFRDGING